MIAFYRGMANLLKLEVSTLDAWDRTSIVKCVQSIYEKAPTVLQERRTFLATQIKALQVALDGLEPATYFLDPDVAVALALFPAEKGLNQLQPPEPDDSEPWNREVHITWELLEASRRLYSALEACAPDLELNVESGCTSFKDGSTWHVCLKDLVREDSDV